MHIVQVTHQSLKGSSTVHRSYLPVSINVVLFKIALEVQINFYNKHAYQSLACETAIYTDFSELFSLKRIYVKYKNAILWLIDCFVHT